MKKKTYWPRGFTRGVPKEEGTYVLLCRDGGSHELVVKEIHILDKETAEQCDTTPGPNVLTLEEYWYAEPEFYGVVGYMKLEGVSAFDLWQHIGKLEDEPPPLDNHPDAVTARLYMEGDPETVARLHIFD